ncbi:NnrS family protein [Litchfieldella xinjiangensis]|uniref:NnrS family protein n=1 Tax=Litchfieldella xinjiangensis TaxID=1166948 RepID=UPI0005B7C15E|nr:NnrS family protein [Halomonas xinjiangensis]
MARFASLPLPASLTSAMPVWRLAFRPFFLLGALFSLAAMLVWGAFWHGDVLLRPHGGMLWWHQHEMLFGFGSAIVAGFLLTAVQNWTGQPGLKGLPLVGLVVVWLAGRGALAFAPEATSLWPALVDLAFLPLVALAMARAVIAVRQWRNLIFVPVLGLLVVANALMHLGVFQGDALMIRGGAHLAVLLIALLMVVLGGRVIPFFTSRKLGRPQAERLNWLERACMGSVMLLVAMQLVSLVIDLPAIAWAVVALFAGAINLLRLARWDAPRSLHEPLLWGLHASYGFVCLGLVMWGLAVLGWGQLSLGLHAVTVGGVGTMMLAMMARVSLGHTGRTIQTLPGIGLALGLMLLAAVLRALVPALWPQVSHWTLSLSILCWLVAFAIFVWHYARPLLTPRVDGQDG